MRTAAAAGALLALAAGLGAALGMPLVEAYCAGFADMPCCLSTAIGAPSC